MGYDDFEPPSWPSKCAPAKEDWIELNRYVCGEDGSYPEEFWNCADIAITSGAYHPRSGQRGHHFVLNAKPEVVP